MRAAGVRGCLSDRRRRAGDCCGAAQRRAAGLRVRRPRAGARDGRGRGRERRSRARPDGTLGAVVLLSPACASFDQFADFEARGETISRAGRKIAGLGGAGSEVSEDAISLSTARSFLRRRAGAEQAQWREGEDKRGEPSAAGAAHLDHRDAVPAGVRRGDGLQRLLGDFAVEERRHGQRLPDQVPRLRHDRSRADARARARRRRESTSADGPAAGRLRSCSCSPCTSRTSA